MISFFNKVKGSKKGFTLIELLVVISIISLLSSVVLASVQSARKKAITNSTINQVRQYTLALELYYDANGFYPNPSGITDNNFIYSSYSCLGTYSDGLCFTNGTSFSENPSSYPTTGINGFLTPYIKPGIFKNNPRIVNATYEGVIYACFNINSANKCSTLIMEFYVEGDAAKKCNFSINPTLASYGYGSLYIASSDVTHCVVTLGTDYNNNY